MQKQHIYTTLKPDISVTAEPGSTVKVSVDGAAEEVASIDATGVWRYAPTEPLTLGPHTLSVTATDEAGNQSDPSTVDFTLDLPRSHYGWSCASTPALPASGIWLVVLVWLRRQGRRLPPRRPGP